MQQKGICGQKLYQCRAAAIQCYLDYIILLAVQLHLALPCGLLCHAVIAAGAQGVVHLPQAVFGLGQAAVFNLPQAAAHLPVQRATVGQAVARGRVGDNGGVQRKVGAAPVQGALAAADRLAEGDAVRTAGQQRVGGELHPVPLGEKLIHAGAVERRRGVQRAELQMPVVLIGNKKAEDMQKRCKIIEDSNALFTVSIHQNSYTSPEIQGAQVFYYGQSENGKKLAEILQTALIEQVDPDNHRAAKANESYYLLKKTPTPTVIVECGFLSNPIEAELLLQDDYQDQLVNAIYTGIKTYLGDELPQNESS